MFSNFLDFPNFYIKLSNFAVVLFSYFVFSINENTDTYLPRNLPPSWNGFRKILVSFLANTTWKVDDINRTIFLAYYCVYFLLRTAVNFTFLYPQAWLARLPRLNTTVKQFLPGNEAARKISSYRWVIGYIFQTWQAPTGYGISQGITANHKRRNIRMSMNEYISLSLIGLHVNPPADSSEQAGVDQIRWTFVAGKL